MASRAAPKPPEMAVRWDDPAVARALDFVRRSATTPIRVSDVVAQSGLSRRSLERRFLAATGHTIRQAVTFFRLGEAKRLLHETDLPMAHLATLAGFGAVSTMARVFRKYERITPWEYRQRSA